MPGGRPTSYDAKIHVPLVETTVKDGATLTQIAAVCGVDTATVKNWMRDHPEFFAAVMRARDKADAPVISKAYTTALGGDQKAIDRWLHNRRPDEFPGQQRVEVSGPEGGAIKHEQVVTESELDTEIRRLAEQLGDEATALLVAAAEGGAEGS